MESQEPISREKLYDLYINQGMVARQIAELTRVTEKIQERLRKLYKIPGHPSHGYLAPGYKKKPMSLTGRQNISKARKGKPLSPENKIKVVAALERYRVNHKGENHPSWKGGFFYDRLGYKLVKAPLGHPHAKITGYIFEHRITMEKHLGRYLEPGEVVHHINGIRDDNRPENLIVTSPSEHMKMEWTKEKREKHAELIRKIRMTKFWTSR